MDTYQAFMSEFGADPDIASNIDRSMFNGT